MYVRPLVWLSTLSSSETLLIYLGELQCTTLFFSCRSYSDFRVFLLLCKVDLSSYSPILDIIWRRHEEFRTVLVGVGSTSKVLIGRSGRVWRWSGNETEEKRFGETLREQCWGFHRVPILRIGSGLPADQPAVSRKILFLFGKWRRVRLLVVLSHYELWYVTTGLANDLQYDICLI